MFEFGLLRCMAIWMFTWDLFDLVSGATLDWHSETNIRWANNCDFNGGDIPAEQCEVWQDCGTKCVARRFCTHFTWTNYRGGTCWLKRGEVDEYKAKLKIDSNSVCGFLVPHIIRKFCS